MTRSDASLLDDGSLTIEWISHDYRIGFSIEPNPDESGWYIVSVKKVGGTNAYGNISNINNRNLIQWLLNYILLNSKSESTYAFP
ncbi:MAG: hypothetical protein U9R20_03265 [Thermodesulfobacteriota bacterium]|nr:hypothetical protein [Thermodesulfobacteriota bacterium]